MEKKKKNVAILYGGYSSEFVISERSANQICDVLKASPYNIYRILVKENKWTWYNEAAKKECPINLTDFTIKPDGKNKIYFDFAFIIIHGTPGEDGKLQGYLDMQNIPYNTPGVFVSSLTFNKYACKLLLKNFDILTPESVLYIEGEKINEEEILKKVGLPCFIKPNNGGSSFGTTKVLKQEDIEPAIQESLKEDSEVIIESFVKGIELSCGLLKTSKKDYIFPVTEIVPKNEFFDFEAKYTAGMADEIVPARVPLHIQEKCQQLSSRIYDLISCKGLVRIDFILRGNQIYFLEVNTIPGMSKESIVPKMIRGDGYTEEEILRAIIDDGINY